MSHSPRDTTLRQDFQRWWKANEGINHGWDLRVIAKRAWYAATQRKCDREKAQTAQFSRLAAENTELRAEVDRLRNELNGIWDAMREAHVSYAEKPIAETIVNLAELARDRAAEIERWKCRANEKDVT